MEEEHTIWEGHPSHLKDLGFHLVCLLFCWLIVPIGLSASRFLSNQFSRYEITSERIRITSGVLSKRMEEMELYRVKDSTFEQPFFLRIFGLANLQVRTSDASNPMILIPAIREANVVRESLRRSVEKMRERKGVREVDYR